MARRLLAAVALAALLAACGQSARPARTWTVRVEDDWPACWRTGSAVECGPASWAPVSADYVNEGGR
jgi:hypothetical protein